MISCPRNRYVYCTCACWPVWYCIAGNFWGSKLSRISKKGVFRGENFHRMLNWLHNGYGLPKSLWRKLSQVVVKSWNLCFLHPKFPAIRYCGRLCAWAESTWGILDRHGQQKMQLVGVTIKWFEVQQKQVSQPDSLSLRDLRIFMPMTTHRQTGILMQKLKTSWSEEIKTYRDLQ